MPLLSDKNIAANNTPFIPWADLASLPELNPPSVMPQGNVGTSLTTFMTLIRECKLPVRVIKKLHLEFPKSRSSRRYGAVMFRYEGHNTTSGGGGDGDGDAPMKTSKDYFDSDCGGGGGGGGGDGGGDGGGGNVPQKTNKDHFGSGGGSSGGGHSDEKMKRGCTGDSGGNKGMKTGDNRDLSEEEEEEEEDEILPVCRHS